MDDLNDEDVQLIRELERNRKSQQRKELREQHANAQAKYRLHLARNKAPTRNDFAIVTLGIVLRAIAASPEHALLRLLREGIEEELVKADFDRDQISIRLGKMLEDCNQDLANWRRSREWRRRHAARIAQVIGS
jgi:hypothetical protein